MEVRTHSVTPGIHFPRPPRPPLYAASHEATGSGPFVVAGQRLEPQGVSVGEGEAGAIPPP